jgi:hypothetical protein
MVPGRWFLYAACLSALPFLGPVHAADLPPGTQAAMRQLNLDDSLLADIDTELKVPDDWIDRARKGPPAKVVGTWDPQQFQKMEPVFRARYPGVKISYSRSDRYNRAINTLVALHEGLHR